jgi:hypothetical protein
VTPLRLALIRADGQPHRYLESLLAGRFDLSLVVIEPEREQVAALRRQGRYRDWAYHRYHRYRRAITGQDRYRRRYFAHSPALWTEPGPGRLTVRSVNEDLVAEALWAAAVDVVVIIGCSILSKATLAAAGPLVINVHGGVLPYYRGVHGAFFAAYERHFDRVGSTLHRVDPGIGTGELIEVVRPAVTGGEPPERLRCHADLLAFHRLAGWLDLLERGGELPSVPQPLAGRTYRTRDRGPTHDLRYFLRRCLRTAGPRHPHGDRRASSPEANGPVTPAGPAGAEATANW